MKPQQILTEIHLYHPPQSLGHLYLEDSPQPGAQLVVAGRQYTVLERRHRYQLQANHYQLHHIAVYVQLAIGAMNTMGSIGDENCKYNAHSALLRCAINPDGPCQDCASFLPKTDIS